MGVVREGGKFSLFSSHLPPGAGEPGAGELRLLQAGGGGGGGVQGQGLPRELQQGPRHRLQEAGGAGGLHRGIAIFLLVQHIFFLVRKEAASPGAAGADLLPGVREQQAGLPGPPHPPQDRQGQQVPLHPAGGGRDQLADPPGHWILGVGWLM